METIALTIAILAGILSAGVVGWALGLRGSWAGRVTALGPAPPLNHPGAESSNFATKQDLREWQLEMEELYEKIKTLYGRVEKRKALLASQEASGRARANEPDAQPPPSNRERARARARAAGILGSLHLATPARNREDLDSGGD